MAINATWHQANRIPKNASLDQRIACRRIPEKLRAEMKKRGR